MSESAYQCPRVRISVREGAYQCPEGANQCPEGAYQCPRVRLSVRSDVLVSESAYQCPRVRISVRSDVFVSEVTYSYPRVRISVRECVSVSERVRISALSVRLWSGSGLLGIAIERGRVRWRSEGLTGLKTLSKTKKWGGSGGQRPPDIIPGTY